MPNRVSAATPWEGRILALWSELLGRAIDDPGANFFDLGGNSLHLAQAHARLGQALGREFPITDLFAHTTARALAAHLGGSTGGVATDAARDRARRQQAGFAQLRRPQRP